MSAEVAERSSDCRWLVEALVRGGHLPLERAALLRDALARSPLSQAWQAVAAAVGVAETALVPWVAAAVGWRVAPAELLAEADTVVVGGVPLSVFEHRWARPLQRSASTLVVASADPTDDELLQLLRFSFEGQVDVCLASPGQIRTLSTPTSADDGALLDTDLVVPGESPLVRLCNQILREAVTRRASDVHIQSAGVGALVRMRIDGVMHPVAQIPRSVMQRLISRIKLLAGMDPTDGLHAQDGQLRIASQGRAVDLRISTVPAQGGEKLVARLLGGGRQRPLREIGIGQPELTQLASALSRGQGLLLVTGPTGSGKTSTLYSALSERNRPEVSIATVEDPVEIRLEGLAQIEVNAKAGMGFAAALRSVLRQDPDVILIGEIRDAETAQIAVQAALTGHLVLATVHANDAPAAIPRLLDLGVSRQLLGETLIGSCAQRLVRRLCERCAVSRELNPSAPADGWLLRHAELRVVREPVGCDACRGTGFAGRLPVAQVMTVDAATMLAIQANEAMATLRDKASAAGMRSLAEAALDRVRDGDTCLAEVERELGGNFWLDLAAARQVPAHQPAADAAQPVGIGGAPLLLIARDPVLRELGKAAGQQRGHEMLLARDALQARVLLAQRGAVLAILVDFSGLNPTNVAALLALRETLGGAAVPMLGFHATEGDAAAIHQLLEDQPGVVLVDRPATLDAVRDLVNLGIERLNA